MEKEFPSYCRMVRWGVADDMRTARITAKLTQQQMADAIGVNRSYISRIENNKCEIPFSMIVKYSVVLRVPLNSLLRSVTYNAVPASEKRAAEEYKQLPKRAKAYVYALMRELNRKGK